MTNSEKWYEYTIGLPSPDNYIRWSWRYIIAASLQRRVWMPPDHQPCYANQYTILVGPPGIGKGLCVTPVSEFLRHWKLKDAVKALEGKSDQDKQTAAAVMDADMKNATDETIRGTNRKVDIIEPLLIPIASDATTYEALVTAVAGSFRRVNYTHYDIAQGKNVQKVYGHSSICFSLPELASLLRKRTDDTVNYLLGLYDCPLDYVYDTKTQGKDRIRRGCLNLFAGTTPSFMQQILNEKLIDQGFGSRTFFIYANKDRRTQFWIPDLTEQQKEYKKELLQHVLQLTTLYGPIQLTPEVKEFLEKWWRTTDIRKNNHSEKLEGYYSRKKVHMLKVAMAEHFSESLEMSIPVETFQRAMNILEEEEKNMHLAITIEGKNNLALVAKKILELLQTGKKNFVDLHVSTYNMAARNELDEALTFLTETNQAVTEMTMDEATEKSEIYWRLK